MIFFFAVVAALFMSLVIQHFIPPLGFLHGARVLLMPVVFFYGALAFPFGAMLLLAFLAGLMWDALTVQVLQSHVEISLGWSILVYTAFGAILSGFRPLYQKGRWEVHCLMSGLFTSLLVLAEYLMITFRRGDFSFAEDVWWRAGGSGLIALLVAPVIFFTLNALARTVGHETQPLRHSIE
jgi:cell shape-determining protein MreD